MNFKQIVNGQDGLKNQDHASIHNSSSEKCNKKKKIRGKSQQLFLIILFSKIQLQPHKLKQKDTGAF